MNTKTSRKGFTIVELVIVIAVIAILAAVLIPTFVGLVNKANVAADTALGRELNSAIAQSEKEVATFDEALEALRDGGFIIANLNAKADGCYFVWESSTKQILYVDANDGFKVIYSNGSYKEIGETWYLAVSNKEKADAIKKLNNTINVKLTLASAKDLSSALAAGGEVYIDESVILDKNNLLTFDTANKNTVVNLGSSKLNTSGILRDGASGVIPVEVKQGTVTFNGGEIATAGENLNYHGLKVAYALQTSTGTTTTFNGTNFNLANNEAQIRIFGTSVMEDVVITASKSGVETRYNGDLTLKNVTIVSDGGTEWYGSCVWSCNFDSKGESSVQDHVGSTKITIESGTYTSKAVNQGYAAVVACGGAVDIKGGTFTAPEGKMFYVKHTTGKITITDGTFNGVAFAELDTVDEWKDLCAGDYNISIGNNVVTITE